MNCSAKWLHGGLPPLRGAGRVAGVQAAECAALCASRVQAGTALRSAPAVRLEGLGTRSSGAPVYRQTEVLLPQEVERRRALEPPSSSRGREAGCHRAALQGGERTPSCPRPWSPPPRPRDCPVSLQRAPLCGSLALPRVSVPRRRGRGRPLRVPRGARCDLASRSLSCSPLRGRPLFPGARLTFPVLMKRSPCDQESQASPAWPQHTEDGTQDLLIAETVPDTHRIEERLGFLHEMPPWSPMPCEGLHYLHLLRVRR
ncbi:PREDICTED: uncharacterized protein LOC102027800 [Chinchilla lanigera]|uniref:uncharacterized protein LOC102027800 n=1 Tax=Chinchilla lanigera TaxID=34839 RepID=UPI0006966FAF|nr:PREDICTED: uncharacterized protein LOC102027800 [Chinchilla lanigera]